MSVTELLLAAIWVMLVFCALCLARISDALRRAERRDKR